MLFSFHLENQNKFLWNYGRIFNIPLGSKSLYVHFIAKEIQLRAHLFAFDSRITCRCKSLPEVPFRFSGSSIQFVESVFWETSQTTDQFGGEERKQRQLSRKHRMSVWRRRGIYVSEPCNVWGWFSGSDPCAPESQRVPSEWPRRGEILFPRLTNCQVF